MKYYTRLHEGVVYSGLGYMSIVDLYLFSIAVDKSGNPNLYSYDYESSNFAAYLESNRVSELCRVKLWEI